MCTAPSLPPKTRGKRGGVEVLVNVNGLGG